MHIDLFFLLSGIMQQRILGGCKMQERYAICFSSKTGNTEALAKVFQETLPEESCAYYGSVDQAPDNAEIY